MENINSPSDGQVAIIVPVYNSGNKLKKCIRSILRQSFDKFMLILVDDGSTDRSGSICDAYAKRDDRLVVIHQENSGSIEARKTGVFSKEAQNAKYLMCCDADDMMPRDALSTLLTNAEKYQADCICGNVRKMVGNIVVPRRFIKFTPPCFQGDGPQIYTHDAIMRDLYISCFGVSNYPVSLYAKLYRRELLTNALKSDPIVRFMGDDLSVTLQIMPDIEKLVIIPDTVYFYRTGGGTSKFMPHMLDDFLALYHYKTQLRRRYEMKDLRTELLMDVELLNAGMSHLRQCKYPGKFTESEVMQEISKVISIPEIQAAAASLQSGGKKHAWAPWILNQDVGAIAASINQWYKQSRFRRTVKRVMSRL